METTMPQSMLRETTGNVIANSIMMSYKTNNIRYLITEGDDDYHIWRQHATENLSVINAHGKPKALEISKELGKYKVPGVFIFVDNDYDGLVSAAEDEYSVYRSVGHDFFMDLIIRNPQVLVRAVEAFGRRVNRDKPDDFDAEKVIEWAWECSSIVGAIRVIHEEMGLGINFRRIDYNKFVSLYDIDIELLIEQLLIKGDSGISHHSLARKIIGVFYSIKDRSSLSGDHDFFRALAFRMREDGVKGMSDDLLQTNFISMIRCEDLRKLPYHNVLCEESWLLVDCEA